MRHKACITLIISLIFFALTMNAFADELTIEDRILSDREIASSIEILSPVVGSDGDVLTNDENLYINIRLNQPVKVYYSLYKIDPRIFGSDEKIITNNTNITENTESLVDDSEELISEELIEDEVEEVVIPEILSELDKEEFRSRIILDYNESKSNLNEAKKILEDYKILVSEELSEESFLNDTLQLSNRENEVLNELEKLKVQVKEKEDNFNYIESRYNQLFEKLILDKVEVKISEVLPYYKSEIEDIDSGEYKMVFYPDDEGQKAIKVFYFSLKTSEETIEKIVDTIPADINNIWEIKPIEKEIQN